MTNTKLLGSKDYVNQLKGIAILAVIGIHTANLFINQNPAGLIPVDQLLRFCVPLFIALSGYALASKYSTLDFTLREFFSRRLLRLLPLYFLWTFIYFLTSQFIPGWGEFVNSFPLWQVFFYGRSEFHLYFVPMIFQAYLLFPLLFHVVKKFPYLSLFLSFIIQLVVFTWINSPGWNDQSQYVLFMTWQFYFILGIFLVFKSPIILNKISPILGLAGLLIAISTALSWFSSTHDLIWATRFTRLPILFYSTGLILFFLSLRFNLPFKKALVFLGTHSYHLYLSHVLFLHIFALLIS